MSSRSNTARTESWSALEHRLRTQRDTARRERDQARAELAATRALHRHRLDALAGRHDNDGAAEWSATNAESLSINHTVLPPDPADTAAVAEDLAA